MTKDDELVVGDCSLADAVEAEPGGEDLWHCMACGTCSAGCPVREVEPAFDPRAIVRLVVLGSNAVFEDDVLWLCSGCNTCEERCPQGVHLPSLIKAIRNVGVRKGSVPGALMAQLDLLRQYGRLLEVEEHNKRRTKIGLPELRNPSADYAVLLELAGFKVEEKDETAEKQEGES